jgi:mevalonate kinase
MYAIRSTIPVGAGLGSSASLAVCMATALLLQTNSMKRPQSDQAPSETEHEICQINKWAFVAEMSIHGNPSGVDNTVSTGGRAVLYQKKEQNQCPAIVPLHRFPELPLLLVNTHQPRNASTEISKVRNLKNKHPAIVEGILDAIDSTTNSAHELISEDDFEPKTAEAQEHLGDLIDMNHGLLNVLGVSHPKLERARELVDELDIGSTKLTGAGGGGCAIVMPKPGMEVHPKETDVPLEETEVEIEKTDDLGDKDRPQSFARRMSELEHRLEDEEMDLFTTTLAGDGVGVLWPAVLGGGVDGEGAVKTSLERFVEAEDKDRLEDLVGLGEKESGWTYLRR